MQKVSAGSKSIGVNLWAVSLKEMLARTARDVSLASIIQVCGWGGSTCDAGALGSASSGTTFNRPSIPRNR